MEQAHRQRIEKLLCRIPSSEWNIFLATSKGNRLQRRIHAVQHALGLKESQARRPNQSRAALVTNLLGYGLMQDRHCGPWIREQFLKKAPAKVWNTLLSEYAALQSKKTVDLRSMSSQRGKAPFLIASYWVQGGRWARIFCEAFELPDAVWMRHEANRVDDEDVIPALPLPPLHDFQVSAYGRLRGLLKKRSRGKTALLSLPTGAGKTRVIVEAICDHMAQTAMEGQSLAVLWIAHSSELQLQAWECFRAVWQVPPNQSEGRMQIRRVQPLRLVRMWGSRNPETIESEPPGPEVLIASIDQLSSWVKTNHTALSLLKERNFVCVVIDEAHGVITPEFRRVLEFMDLKAERRWLPKAQAPLLIGLTATPWRKSDVQDASLRRFFSYQLVLSNELGDKPVEQLQARKILSIVKHSQIDIRSRPSMSAQQIQHIERYRDLPLDYLEELARSSGRNRRIIQQLISLKESNKTLVFACSIEHSETLAACLNVQFGPGSAISVTSATPRSQRALMVEQFKCQGQPRFLCTVGVLAAGFDAPKVDAVVITRPTMSAGLYEQMVGRGLRGVLNGGTKTCQVIDVQDYGLPDGILSYARVLERWSRR